MAALCWEIKNQLVDLLRGGEIVQTGAEVAGELEAMLNRFDVKPPRYTAVHTNGVAFLFVMATLVNGVYSWTHSPVVTNAASAAAMIEGSFAVAAEVLQLFHESYNVPDERLPLDDIDGDDSGDHTESGGAGDGAKSGSVGASVGRGARKLVEQRQQRKVWELKSRETHWTIASPHLQYPMLICSTVCAVVFQFLIF